MLLTVFLNSRSPKTRYIGSAIVLAICPLVACADGESPVDASALLADTCESTVRVEGINRKGRYTTRSHGAGVVVSGDGYIVTALHVVEGFQKVVVRTCDGQALSARSIRSSSKLDLALLKCQPARELKSAFFRPPAKTESGDEILAIGNPGGCGQRARSGVLGETRTVQWCNTEAELRAVAAPIRPGYSGGGSYDLGTGELVGIQVAQSATRPDVGYIVPEEVVQNWVAESRAVDPCEMELQDACRKRLGCWLRPVKLNHPNFSSGLMATKFESKSPAKDAGWREEDVLVALDGYKTKSLDDVDYVLDHCTAAGPVRFRVLHKEEMKKGVVLVGKPPANSVVEKAFEGVEKPQPTKQHDPAVFAASRRDVHPDIVESFEFPKAVAASNGTAVAAHSQATQTPERMPLIVSSN